MRKFLFALLFSAIGFGATAQFVVPPYTPNDPTLPEWVKMMYSEQPNVFEVDRAYQEARKTMPKGKTTFSQYYKHWRKSIAAYVNEEGFIDLPTAEELTEKSRAYSAMQSSALRNGQPDWTFAGPKVHYVGRYNANDPNFLAQSDHANLYSIDRSLSHPNILYCGGESGGVYKSTDQGINWEFVSAGLAVYSVRTITIHPTNPDIVIFSAADDLYRSNDGGLTWQIIGDPAFRALNINAWEILFHPTQTNLVFAATNMGLFRSTDGGDNWTEILAEESMSIRFKANDPNTVFAMQYDAATKIPYFYKSTDAGLTFTIKPSGWFQVPPADAGLIESYGGRIATTNADPDRVYVLLVGQSQAAATLKLNGFIGIYVSNDGGETWTHPHGLIGSPYSVPAHPNPMTFGGDDNSYNQIYYNTTICASHLNPDEILFGGLSLWRSVDAGATYTAVGGYVGNVPNIHPDMQTLKSYQTGANSEEVWWSSDGGVNYSTDFVNSHESRARGIFGSAFWGFDQGWNEDMMIGGRYHNRNAAYHEGYTPGEFIVLGGGEAPTGYINYSPERKTYSSDIGGRVIPNQANGLITGFPMAVSPNEVYWQCESSRIMFDYRYWNIAYLGKDHQFYKSTDGGSSFSVAFTFGNNPNNKIFWIEQSRANPDVFYAQQQIGSYCFLHRSTDGGTTWTTLTLPQNNRRYWYFTTSGTNPDELWIAYTNGGNGNLVYHSTNGGQTWTNITTATLNGLQIWAIAHQFGTDGGVYVAGQQGGVYYKNNNLPDWQPIVTGLPLAIDPLRLVPFYKGEKIRLATWNIGIWEADLYEQSAVIADFAADFAAFRCPGDTIFFTAHAVAPAGAQYEWLFPNGTPSVATGLYPKVTYAQAGTYDVRLIVSANGQSDTLWKTGYITTSPTTNLPLIEGFESGAFPNTWTFDDAANDNTNWQFCNYTGGYDASDYCMFFDNYYIDVQGRRDAVLTAKYDFSGVQNAKVTFDVAYAEYGGQYTDTLAVLVSTDCGATFTELYVRGGDGLATAPDLTAARFEPDSSQWRTDTVNLSAFAGTPELIIAFQNRGRWGQALYVDNINLNDVFFTGQEPIAALSAMSVFPNPMVTGFNLRFAAATAGDFNWRMTDVQGKIIIFGTGTARQGENTYSMNTALPAGSYTLSVEKDGVVYSQKIIQL